MPKSIKFILRLIQICFQQTSPLKKDRATQPRRPTSYYFDVFHKQATNRSNSHILYQEQYFYRNWNHFFSLPLKLSANILMDNKKLYNFTT